MIITSPQVVAPNSRNVFLAGGITGCWDWQQYVIDKLQHLDIDLINPRRANFDTSNPKITHEQIIWEYNYLKLCHSCMFWFPSETLCPITLYELGKMQMSGKKLFLGVDKEYERKEDIEIQTSLISPDTPITNDLDQLCHWITVYFS